MGAVARTLGVSCEVDPSGVGALVELNAAVARDGRRDWAWLVLTGLYGAMPRRSDVEEYLRIIELLTPDEVALSLLARALPPHPWGHRLERRLEVLEGAVVADVDTCARTDRHTGIQRVVRESVPRWVRAHPEVLTLAWTDEAAGFRRLTDLEQDRVLRWNEQTHVGRADDRDADEVLVVPWASQVLLPEVPAPQHSAALAALAEFSGNRVSAIGYDAIPIVSADIRPPHEPDNYVSYLSVIKHCAHVAGISVSAALEFKGFAQMLPSQGLRGPQVSEVFLPGEAPKFDAPADDTDLPSVVCVGSQEVHKNHLAILEAADVLWREGEQFRLSFVGGPGWDPREFEARVAELQAEERPVEIRRGVSDEAMWHLYATARFTVFPSLHEGYGLPVAESLAFGTPVVTTAYGSMQEIAAAGGGCLLIDPRDDLSLTDGMRRMLRDDALVERLRTEARGRPQRDWDRYAAEAWQALTEGSPAA
jgi:glycosyltransferase involved in cell wall biosynthesis